MQKSHKCLVLWQNIVQKLKKDQRRPGRPVMGMTVALGPADQSFKYKVIVVVLSLDASECEHMSITRSNSKQSLVVHVSLENVYNMLYHACICYP